MKLMRRALLLVILLVIVVLVIGYLNLNRIVRTTVESQATDQLKLQTTLGSADLALFGGEVKLSDLKIASPQGFSAPQMFTLGGTAVKVNYSQLRQEPIHISSITISKPLLVIEQENGKLNFKVAMDQIPSTPSQPAPSESKSEPLKLIIDDLTIETPTVVMRPGDISKIPGVSLLGKSLPQEITIPIPTVNLKNIGSGDGNQNGAALKDVVMQVITAIADSASKSGALPDELKGLMNVNLADVKAQLGAQFQKQLAGLTGKLPGGVGNVIGNPGDLAKDPGKALQQGVGNLIGNKPSDAPPSTQPDAAKSVEQGLQGLLEGKKKQ